MLRFHCKKIDVMVRFYSGYCRYYFFILFNQSINRSVRKFKVASATARAAMIE